jgi:pimeloyl-ACP methyl ester carboxylesterase
MTGYLDTAGTVRVDLPVTGPHGPSVAALQAGPPDGTAVLLVPGYTGSKEDFAPLLKPLAAAGFLVTTIDLPGQHESVGSADPADYSVEVLGDVVGQIAALLPAPLHLLGHSFGGLVTRAAVIADPSRYASFVLMDSGPGRLGGARADVVQLLAPLLESHGMAGLWEASNAYYSSQPDFVEPSAALAEFFKTRFLAQSPQMLQGMADALLNEPDRVAELAATGVPTLVLYGLDDDAWLPADQDEMATRLGATVAVIPDAAHSPAVENSAATLDALLKFWA